MCWRVDGACLSGQRSFLAKGTQNLVIFLKKCFFLTEVSYLQTVCKQATRIKKPGFGGFICWLFHIIKAIFLLSLFSSHCFLRFPVMVEILSVLNLLEFSSTVFSFISFILAINESWRPLTCDLYSTLPPYSNAEAHPSSPADWGSLWASPASWLLVSPHWMFVEWVDGWMEWMNEWMRHTFWFLHLLVHLVF